MKTLGSGENSVDIEGKKFFMVVAYICCGLIGSLALLCASFAFSVLGRNACDDLKNGFSDLVDSWDADRIYDITSNPSYSLPSSDYYLKAWAGLWPGTSEGCHCTVSSSRKKVSKGLKDRSCNSNETSVGCTSIDSTPRKDLNIWSSSQNLMTVRVKNTSFLDTYLKIDSKGGCSSDFVNCGNKESKSRGACLPSKYSTCPLTNVSSTSITGYNTTALTGFSLYTSNAQTSNPICEAYIREDHLCFIRSHMPLTPGRSKYLLFSGEYGACRTDQTAWSVGEMGEKTFFDLNQITSYYTRLTEASFSDFNKVKLLLARGLEWSPDCADIVPTMTAKKGELAETYDQFKNMVIIYSIAFSFSVLTVAVEFLSMCSVSRRALKCAFVTRVLFFSMAIAPVVITYTRTRNFYKYFERIQDLQCSNDETNSNFAQFTQSVKSNLGYKTEVTLGCLICSLLVDALLIPLIFICVFPPRRSESEPAQLGSVTPVTHPSPEREMLNDMGSHGTLKQEESHLMDDKQQRTIGVPVPVPFAVPVPVPVPVPVVTINENRYQDNELASRAEGGKPLSFDPNNPQNHAKPHDFNGQPGQPGNQLPPGFIGSQNSAPQNPTQPQQNQPLPPGFGQL